MISKKRFSHPASFITLVISILLIISACSSPAPQATATPTLGFDLGSDGTEIPDLACPDEKTLFTLWFSHLSVLDIDMGDGETFYLQFDNIPPSFFDLWINADGVVTNEGIFSETTIGYHGVANHPDDDDCPVQTFEGVWRMKAEISGVCVNDVVTLHIKEEFLDSDLHSSCGDAIGPGEGLYSGPELDLTFDLNSDFPADGITIPEGGPFHASYDYALYPAGYELPVVPLPGQ